MFVTSGIAGSTTTPVFVGGRGTISPYPLSFNSNVSVSNPVLALFKKLTKQVFIHGLVRDSQQIPIIRQSIGIVEVPSATTITSADKVKRSDGCSWARCRGSSGTWGGSTGFRKFWVSRTWQARILFTNILVLGCRKLVVSPPVGGTRSVIPNTAFSSNILSAIFISVGIAWLVGSPVCVGGSGSISPHPLAFNSNVIVSNPVLATCSKISQQVVIHGYVRDSQQMAAIQNSSGGMGLPVVGIGGAANKHTTSCGACIRACSWGFSWARSRVNSRGRGVCSSEDRA
mmetsp:Transcript_16598/g.45575  ORF Transcript_16598/g.45575 Transcript_16598/m.45575 type:complete len:286 (-) Transcript_16598:271-1128(-)